jgi:hypothetical protein
VTQFSTLRTVAIVAAAVLAFGIGAVAAPAAASTSVTSGDATVITDSAAGTWTLQSSAVRRVVSLQSGKLLQTALLNLTTGTRYQQSGASTEFRVRVAGTDYRGSSGGWVLDGSTATVEANSSIHLTIRIHNAIIGIARNYWLFPSTSFIEERTDLTNRSTSAQTVSDYSALEMRVLGDDAGSVDLYRMSGDKSSGTYQSLIGPVAQAAGSSTFGGSGGNGNQEFLSYRDRARGEGIVATWDYTGRWSATVGDSYGKLLIEPRATAAFSLAPSATITGPLGRAGFYQGDLDDMGNAVLDFTYRYLWNDTSSGYFPLIRYGGYGSDPATISAKIKQLAYIGGDMVWMDDGWQDAVGDWNATPGEPLAEYRDYAADYGMKVGYWLVPWGAEGSSQVAAAHPEWMVDATDRKAGLKTTLPAVQQHIDQLMQQKQDQYGPFMLKTDFGADSGDLPKANATMQILQDFVDHNPGAGLQLCSDGGGLMNLGTVGLSDLALQRDGTAGREDGYWTSLLYPTEKLIASYGRGDIGAYSASNRHLLSFHLTIAGDTAAGPAALEPLRVDAELYRYLNEQGVMGRWVKVYRPTVSTGSAVGILQKLSDDRKRGYITFPKAAFAAGAAVTVTPKGLDPQATYVVASQNGSVATTTKTGAAWMSSGIPIASYSEGEVLYFNLQTRPGSGTDTVTPSAPSAATKVASSHLGSSGVDLSWTGGSDDRRVSYYEISRNGASLTKVSTGRFFFDATGATADTYRVRTVDGDGNASAWTAVAG